MVPQFRASLLAVDDKSDNPVDSVLSQLQSLFTHLQESEKKFYDPTTFCRAFKQDGKPMDPNVQMDVDEFLNFLFDKLESLIKGTPQEQVLKQFFGGSLVHQIGRRQTKTNQTVTV